MEPLDPATISALTQLNNFLGLGAHHLSHAHGTVECIYLTKGESRISSYYGNQVCIICPDFHYVQLTSESTAGFDGPPTKAPVKLTEDIGLSPGISEEAQPTESEEAMMNRDDIPGYDFEVKEQDKWLPIANVARIMKTALPENAKISKEAKECIQECVSEFISFITSEAIEKCQQEKRKTVNGEDVLFAMTSLGFENYAEALKIYLARYRENQAASTEQQKLHTTPTDNTNPNER